MVSRRKFMVAGGATAVAVVASKAISDSGKMPSAAIAPWSPSQLPDSDIRKKLLSYAILAPNPHNIQPWLVDLTQPGLIDLYCDRTRLLPQTDPFSRQIIIGHGTFLELLDLAASATGYRADITYFPQGEFGKDIDDRPVASIRLTPAPERKADPLFQHILQRRSTKVPFDMTNPLTPDHTQRLATACTNTDCQLSVTTEQPQVLGLQGMMQSGMEIEMRTPRTYQESVDLMRIGSREVKQHRDGIDLTSSFIGWGRLLGLVNREKLADPATSAFRSGVTMYREMATTTPAFAWITTSDNTRSTQLATGRAYARLNLKATELGVAIHPMSQVLQEYAEMQALQQGLLKMLDIPEGHTVQMLVRLGYAQHPSPSPRRELEDFLLS